MDEQELFRIYMRRARRKGRGKFGSEKRIQGVRALIRASSILGKMMKEIVFV